MNMRTATKVQRSEKHMYEAYNMLVKAITNV